MSIRELLAMRELIYNKYLSPGDWRAAGDNRAVVNMV